MSHSVTRLSLLSRVRDLDDHASWREFDDRYRHLILGYCRRRGLQHTDAEDIRQLVMLSLARRLRAFRYEAGKGRFRDYLGRTTVNAIRTLQGRRRETSGEGGDEAYLSEPVDDVPLDQEWENEWMLHHYRLAMETVRRTADPRSVDVFERLVAGEGVAEIAESCGMSRDAVNKVKQRMRDRLKEAVAEQIRDEELVESPGGS